MAAEYAIGIDLGTTNSVLAYTPLHADKPSVQVLRIRQLVAPGQVDFFDALPSFLLQTNDESLHLDWQAEALTVSPPQVTGTPHVVGMYARSQAAEQPERTVSAAKSWLCHPQVDRRSPILPWDSPDDSAKISPVNASAAYLAHLAACWNEQFPDAPLRDQLVVLTVPASFDVVARELTREAALLAGLPNDFVLLEEPQAAVYHWILNVGDRWRKHAAKGDKILVVDIGGGTTDLTLLQVDENEGDLVLHREAVGDHLLVGGENMDLTLAHYAAQRFRENQVRLNAWQSVSLWHACRAAKESLLSDSERHSYPITVLGRGTKLIGGTTSIELTRDEALATLLDGFFPVCSFDDKPHSQAQSGFHELGLPFEADTGITRHIAAFLNRSLQDGRSLGRIRLLFNGGVFKGKVLRQRLIDTIASWGTSEASPTVLGGPEDLDRSVACGAAYYAWMKRHGGIRIRGGTTRSYYVGVEASGLAVPGMPRPLQALCVVPFGMEEGTEQDVPGRPLGLTIGQPSRFPFYHSSLRKDDRPGTVIRYIDEEALHEAATLELCLPGDEQQEQSVVPVRFHSKITELGVFELWCHSVQDDRRWKLEFDVRRVEHAPMESSS